MKQSSLFALPPLAPSPSIQGLSYIEDWISPAHEAELIAQIDTCAWSTELKRRVQHYGYRYDYSARQIKPDLYLAPLPDWALSLAQRLVEQGLFSVMPDQVIINEYRPGQGIAAHVDCVPCFGATIASLSLGAACVMEFSRETEKHSQLLAPRSLLMLSDDARYVWKHGIAARKTDRIAGQTIPRARRLSLTFRTVKL